MEAIQQLSMKVEIVWIVHVGIIHKEFTKQLIK